VEGREIGRSGSRKRYDFSKMSGVCLGICGTCGASALISSATERCVCLQRTKHRRDNHFTAPFKRFALEGLGEVVITPALHAGDFCSTQRDSPNPSGSVSLSESPEIPAAKLGACPGLQNQGFISEVHHSFVVESRAPDKEVKPAPKQTEKSASNVL
jgi:hypothetical protein